MRRFPTALLVLVAVTTPLFAQKSRTPKANFEAAERYSSSYLRQRTYSTSVEPRWIGETDRFWYSYRTAVGTHYWLVDPAARAKTPLFDQVRLASLLSVEVKKPLDAGDLGLENVEIDDEGAKLSFVLEKTKFELELATGALANLGEVPEGERGRGVSTRINSGRGRNISFATSAPDSDEPDPRAHRSFSPDRTAYTFLQGNDLYYVEASLLQQAEIHAIDARMKKEAKEKAAAEKASKVEGVVQEKVDEKKVVEKKVDQKKDDTKADDTKDAEAKKEEDKVDERERWADKIDETKALRLTDDGEEDYEFSSGGGFRRGAELILDEDAYLESLQAGEVPPGGEFAYAQDEEKKKDEKGDAKKDAEEEPDPKSRPRVNWAPDSSAFYITRRDTRGVEQLFLVNSLTEPRPSLETYDYPLPGEENIGHSELFLFDRARKTLTQVTSKWKDESYQNTHWPRTPTRPDTEGDEEPEPFTKAELAGSGDELRFLRRDRLLRNIELCSVDTRTGATTVLFDEGFVSANIAPQSLRYLKTRKEMIWWSERSGWGHFYLYGSDGKLKNAITSGPFRASRIVDVDEEKGILYFLGNAREPGENVYLQHLYRVFLDGSGLTLLDPGDANHRSALSPTKAYLVDNCSRIDMAPVSRLCDAEGKQVMQLEEADLSRLYEAGWTMPETFTFKAADGVTDLYGNMWKPFDFDPKKKYPIIAEVYPGPQTEGVSHSFSSSNGRQQLAQIGFIVVQLGHRGGTPGRSKAYHSYGYNNLRDYGLADKKAGIEQLAERHPYIDIDKVGLYGHSGGGFMTAAALLREPYNDFFKVGVSSSGNHDNNVYGRHWAERYHGLKEVEVPKKKAKKASGADVQLDVVSTKDAAQDVEKKDTVKKEDGQKDGEEKQEDEVETKFEIHVPTNAELAANLKGKLLLTHGDMDNNVHPAGTMRLVDALIKANKRFDLMIFPGKRHGYGDYNGYFTRVKWEYFAEHLLGATRDGADID